MSEQNSRFAVGIDLGTTHSVLAYVDQQGSDEHTLIQGVLPIPQLVDAGVVSEKEQLPSFIYQAHSDELSPQDRVLPWDSNPRFNVGQIARHLGSKTPIRLVSSAKSWLCHAGVNGHSPILPISAPEDVERISPFQASSSYLAHLRDAWNHAHPDAPLEQQQITITVPASFDPAARELTAEAAREVGIGNAILLEEPQAALYSWISNSEGNWREQVQPGDVILVVDIGGGTTDLSLIAVTEVDGNLELNRIAVGDHILLGGDNMDLALAYTVKAKLEAEGKTLEPWQVQALTQGCRDAKEKLLSDNDTAAVPLVVPSRGSSLIGGALRTELTRDEVNQVLLEGFLPQASITDKPFIQARTGLTTISLPYAQDAGITRHLAAFLSRQRGATDDLPGFDANPSASFSHPTAILFNGGVLKAERFTRRLMDIINGWLAQEQASPARLLQGADLDLAVARGAAYYGHIREQGGVRIRGGTAASYYIGVESAMPAVPGIAPPIQALCIAPFGMEEGSSADLPGQQFGLIVGEPVHFRFFASKTRREDPVGMLLPGWSPDELEELDQIEITLPAESRQAGEVVTVGLKANVTEVGTLQLLAVASEGEGQWKLEFDVRQASEADLETLQTLDSQTPEWLDNNSETASGNSPTDSGSETPNRSSLWPFNK